LVFRVARLLRSEVAVGMRDCRRSREQKKFSPMVSADFCKRLILRGLQNGNFGYVFDFMGLSSKFLTSRDFAGSESKCLITLDVFPKQLIPDELRFIREVCSARAERGCFLIVLSSIVANPKNSSTIGSH
jgi:hypothetical protein